MDGLGGAELAAECLCGTFGRARAGPRPSRVPRRALLLPRETAKVSGVSLESEVSLLLFFEYSVCVCVLCFREEDVAFLNCLF